MVWVSGGYLSRGRFDDGALHLDRLAVRRFSFFGLSRGLDDLDDVGDEVGQDFLVFDLLLVVFDVEVQVSELLRQLVFFLSEVPHVVRKHGDARLDLLVREVCDFVCVVVVGLG